MNRVSSTQNPDNGIEKTKNSTVRQKVLRRVSVALLAVPLLFLGVIVKAYFDGQFNTVESLQSYVAGYGSFGPLFLTAFQAAQVVIPVLPGFLGCAVGSVLFGPVAGFLCNYIGISAGSVLAFFLARKYGMPLIRELFPSVKYQKWSSWAAGSKSFTGLLFLAMVLPLFPDDYLCYFSGVTEMKAKKFIWIIVLGKPWCILAYSLGFSLI